MTTAAVPNEARVASTPLDAMDSHDPVPSPRQEIPAPPEPVTGWLPIAGSDSRAHLVPCRGEALDARTECGLDVDLPPWADGHGADQLRICSTCWEATAAAWRRS